MMAMGAAALPAGQEDGGDGGAPSAQLSRSVPHRPSSLRELVGSDEAMMAILAFLGPFELKERRSLAERRSLTEALALGRLVPGVCVSTKLKIGPAGASLLASDACLGGLRLRKGSSWARVFDALKVNTTMHKLNLRGCRLKARHVVLLADALAVSGSLSTCGLHELDLSSTKLGEASASGRAIVAALTGHATLRKLNLSQNELGDSVGAALFEAMRSNRTLSEVNVHRTGLGMASGVAIADVVRENPTLHVLNLSENRLDHSEDGNGSSSWPKVLAALQDNVGLQTLRLVDCMLTAHDGQVLASALAQQPPGSGALQVLVLHGNSNLQDAGCCAVMSACLKSGSALRELDMSSTGMTHVGGPVLARLLRANHTLQVLVLLGTHLADNYTGAAGSTWPEVLAALEFNSGLRKLRLQSCGLKLRDLEALAVALRANRVLQELDLEGNRLNDDAVAVLVAGLATNTALRVLNLRSNALGGDTIVAFTDLFQTGAALPLRKLDLREVGGLVAFNAKAKANLRQTFLAAGCEISL